MRCQNKDYLTQFTKNFNDICNKKFLRSFFAFAFSNDFFHKSSSHYSHILYAISLCSCSQVIARKLGKYLHNLSQCENFADKWRNGVNFSWFVQVSFMDGPLALEINVSMCNLFFVLNNITVITNRLYR